MFENGLGASPNAFDALQFSVVYLGSFAPDSNTPNHETKLSYSTLINGGNQSLFDSR